MRKGSWAGGVAKAYGDLDKENVDAVREEEEGDGQETLGVEAAMPDSGMQLVSLREREVEAEVEREMTGRSSGSTLTADEDGMTESESDFVSVTDGTGSERDELSEAGTLRRRSRVTDVSSSTWTEDYSEYDSDETRSDVTESAIGMSLSEGTVGNEVVLAQQG